jgi:hypothetical protein
MGVVGMQLVLAVSRPPRVASVLMRAKVLARDHARPSLSGAGQRRTWQNKTSRSSRGSQRKAGFGAGEKGRRQPGERNMTTVFIEARPKGRREGTAIVDYVVEEQGDRVLKAFKTQAEAITWAKSEGHSPHVARVRHLNDKKIPDHWRPV